MEIKKSNYLIAVVFASLLMSAMAGGHRKLPMNKNEAAGSMGSMQQLHQEDDAVAVVRNHERILRHVKMDDYGRYDPTPTMSKPHFKDIPN